MTINLDLVIETEEYAVDMKAGLDSMQGVSDAIRCIAESILTENTPKRQSHKGSVRTSLKNSFKGSYGQVFSLDIHDPELLKRFRKIGSGAFFELVSYFIDESLYREPNTLSAKAQGILNKLGDISEEVVRQLRVSSLKNIHVISTKFNHDIRIRHRISRENQTVIASFNKETAKVLQARQSPDAVSLTVSITRLNIHTGNGRLQVKDQEETIPFSFGIQYKEVSLRAKKIFSENLNHNNGINNSEWKFLRISAAPVRLKDGKIIKYIVKGFHDE